VITKKEEDSILAFHIPKNLDSCIELLCEGLTYNELEEAKKIDELDFVYKNHHGFGRQIRNGWKLWDEESDLHKYFRNKGIFHADDMSSIIMTSFHRKLTGKDIRLEEQVEYYMNYWIRIGKNAIPEDLYDLYFPDKG
jgi:hypothetical protein